MPEPVAHDTSTDEPAVTGTNVRSRSDSARLIALAALALAIVATVLGAYAALRPRSADADGSYDQAQQDEAITTVCAAFDTVRDGVGLNTNAKAPGGASDVTGTLAVAANARLSLFGGGQYLLARLSPATPGDLADEVRTLGNQLLDIGATSIAGVQTSDPAQAARLKDAQALSVTIADKCKGA